MRCDILGIGCATVDELLFVERYPDPDEKVAVHSRTRQCGGLTASALVAAARFGARCAYGGALGPDEDSEFIRNSLARSGIDLSLSSCLEEARPIHSTIVVDTGTHTRNIFFVPGTLVGPDVRQLTEDMIASSGALFVDHYGAEATIQAMKMARELRIPVVADIERSNLAGYEEILDLAEHLVVSLKFAYQITSASTPEAAAQALWTKRRAAVIVTCGAAGCWAMDEFSGPRRFPAFKVPVRDTTGCGDVFHGVYTAALVQQCSLEERIRYASAAAALKAMHVGAQHGAPNRMTVEEFLKQRASRLDAEPR